MATPDPIAEAEVFIAYGRKAQAIELLKEAARAHPERDDIRERLSSLEVGSPADATHQTKLVLVLAVIVALVAVAAGSMGAF